MIIIIIISSIKNKDSTIVVGSIYLHSYHRCPVTPNKYYFLLLKNVLPPYARSKSLKSVMHHIIN